MSINQKTSLLIIGMAICSILLIGYIFTHLNNLSTIFQTELPDKIKALSQSVYIKYLSDKTLYYDEVLTQSARNYAFTGDLMWKKRYQVNEKALEVTIQQAQAKGNLKDSLNFQRLNQANQRLVNLEYQSFLLKEQKRDQEAIQLLSNDNYWALKASYLASLQDYLYSKDQEIEAILANMESLVNEHDERERNLSSQLKLGTLSYSGALLAGTWVFLFIFMRDIVNRLNHLKEGANKLQEGAFQHRIQLASKDELGDLALAFNSMAANLEEMTKKINQKALRKELSEQRSRFSQELHDRLGITISSIKLQLNRMHKANHQHPEQAASLQSCEKLIDEAYSQIREISNNPLPDTITENGLKKSLNELFARTEMIFRIPVQFFTNIQESDFPDSHKASLYLLIRELLNNAIKHSEGSRIICQIIRHETDFLIMFEDDGIGISSETLKVPKGNGIPNVRDRVREMGGRLEFDSSPGKGTTISIELPLSDGPITNPIVNNTSTDHP